MFLLGLLLFKLGKYKEKDGIKFYSILDMLFYLKQGYFDIEIFYYVDIILDL